MACWIFYIWTGYAPRPGGLVKDSGNGKGESSWSSGIIERTHDMI